MHSYLHTGILDKCKICHCMNKVLKIPEAAMSSVITALSVTSNCSDSITKLGCLDHPWIMSNTIYYQSTWGGN